MSCITCKNETQNLLLTCQTCNKSFCWDQNQPSSLSHVLQHLGNTNHTSFEFIDIGVPKCHCGVSNILKLFKDAKGAVFCEFHKSSNSVELVKGSASLRMVLCDSDEGEEEEKEQEVEVEVEKVQSPMNTGDKINQDVEKPPASNTGLPGNIQMVRQQLSKNKNLQIKCRNQLNNTTNKQEIESLKQRQAELIKQKFALLKQFKQLAPNEIYVTDSESSDSSFTANESDNENTKNQQNQPECTNNPKTANSIPQLKQELRQNKINQFNTSNQLKYTTDNQKKLLLKTNLSELKQQYQIVLAQLKQLNPDHTPNSHRIFESEKIKEQTSAKEVTESVLDFEIQMKKNKKHQQNLRTKLNKTVDESAQKTIRAELELVKQELVEIFNEQKQLKTPQNDELTAPETIKNLEINIENCKNLLQNLKWKMSENADKNVKNALKSELEAVRKQLSEFHAELNMVRQAYNNEVKRSKNEQKCVKNDQLTVLLGQNNQLSEAKKNEIWEKFAVLSVQKMSQIETILMQLEADKKIDNDCFELKRGVECGKDRERELNIERNDRIRARVKQCLFVVCVVLGVEVAEKEVEIGKKQMAKVVKQKADRIEIIPEIEEKQQEYNKQPEQRKYSKNKYEALAEEEIEPKKPFALIIDNKKQMKNKYIPAETPQQQKIVEEFAQSILEQIDEYNNTQLKYAIERCEETGMYMKQLTVKRKATLQKFKETKLVMPKYLNDHLKNFEQKLFKDYKIREAKKLAEAELVSSEAGVVNYVPVNSANYQIPVVNDVVYLNKEQVIQEEIIYQLIGIPDKMDIIAFETMIKKQVDSSIKISKKSNNIFCTISSIVQQRFESFIGRIKINDGSITFKRVILID